MSLPGLRHAKSLIATVLLLGLGRGELFAQVECVGSGNLRGIRVDGQLMAFTTSIRMVTTNSAPAGGRRGQGGAGGGEYTRNDVGLVVTGSLTGGGRRGGRRGPVAGVDYRAVYRDLGPGTVDAQIDITATTNMPMRGVYYHITLPGADFVGGSAQWLAPDEAAVTPATLASTNDHTHASALGVRVTSPRRQFQIDLAETNELTVRGTADGGFDISFPLSKGDLVSGQDVHAGFLISVAGAVDTSPANVAVDLSKPGPVFDGMGGNFRLQSPVDPQFIQYNLSHLRTAWGRVAMPLNLWQSNVDMNPVQEATAGRLNTNVAAAMAMAQTLAQKNIPFVISLWFVPDWAVAGGEGGYLVQGKPIDPTQWDNVCKSIGSYLQYMKEHYGAEADFFSFNESDLGINVLQTPEQHDETIKRLGAYFASIGLKTKMLLGDTGNPTGTAFIDIAAADPDAAKYIGAVSFHSWNGGTHEQYTHFSAAARRLNVPLIVCEGGLDPQAYQYRNTFLEPWYCLGEISQYVDICRVAQPLSILQWQFTSDYGILTGGFEGKPFAPAQRFWQIKQLGMTAPGAKAIPVDCDNTNVTACAFDDHGACVVHLVNNGPACAATITGLPPEAKTARVFVTDAQRGMQETNSVPVAQGKIQLPLDAMSFTTLSASP
jgi:O-glycosyl hydrolase